MRSKKIFLSMLGAMILMMANVGAEPVTDDERIDIELRRTTLVVSDIENSLHFYRDALGFQVIYDNLIRVPGDAQSDEEAVEVQRVVFLRANDDYIGVIGLAEYAKPRKPVRALESSPFNIGSVVLVFTTTDLQARFAKAVAVPGVRVLIKPTDTSYPSGDGSGTIDVRESTLYDPDGFLVELSELLD